jgi:hypothetical protein
LRSQAKAASAIAVICAVVLCLSASPAMAAKGVVGFFGGTGTLGGQFSNAAPGPGDVAVNLNGTGGASPGDVYVVDRANNRIQQFSEDGAFIRAFGFEVNTSGSGNICTVAANCKAGTASSAAGGMGTPQGIVVEQGTGNLYVTDQGNHRVDVYSATGVFQGAFGWNVAAAGDPGDTDPTNQFELCATNCQEGEVGASAGQFGGLLGYPAISPLSGDLLVADKSNRRVQEFKPTITAGQITAVSVVRAFGFDVVSSGPDNTGTGYEVCNVEANPTDVCKEGSIGTGIGQFATNSPGAIAIDSSGRAYVLDNNRVQTFSATATPGGVFASTKLSGTPVVTDLAVDPGSGHLLAAKPCNATTCPEATLATEKRVLELDSAGTVLESHAVNAGIPAATPGLAVGSGGKLYLTTNSGSEAKPGVFILSSPPVPPVTTISSPTNVTGTGATFEGHVKTDAIPASYRFEYSPDGSTWTKVPAIDVALPGDSADHAVSATVSGLSAKTSYQVKLVATKSFAGGTASAETSFETASSAPVITATSHSKETDTSVVLEGSVNPSNEATKYRFEYVTQEHFEEEGFLGAESAPAPAGSLPAGSGTEAVEATVEGLQPLTAYRYRLTAGNATGTASGAVGRFATFPAVQQFDACGNDEFRGGASAVLPDCRAYEQVTPVDKNGGSVQAVTYRHVAAPDGSAISFESAAGIPGGEGSQAFPTYVAKRSGSGWSTQGLLPPATAGLQAAVRGWTPDYATAFDFAGSFSEGSGLFARSTTGAPLTEIVPHTSPRPTYAYIGASGDGSTVLFGAQPLEPKNTTLKLLPAAAPGKPNLYAWDRDTDTLRLAGVLPDGSTPTQGSSTGRVSNNGDPETYNHDMHAVSSDGSVFFNDLGDGQLYLRLNPGQPETPNKDPLTGDCEPDPVLACTVHISASHKDDGQGTDGHDAAGSREATLRAASPDGSRVVFTSAEKLTNDATTGPEPEAPTIARAALADVSDRQLDFLPAFAGELAVDEAEGYLYWTDPSHGRISRAKLDGSVVEEDFITGLDEPLDVAVIDEAAAKHVFWTERGPLDANGKAQADQGTIGRADLDAGNNVTNVNPDCYTGLDNPRSIAVRPDFIYWTAPRLSDPDFGDVNKAELTCNQANVSQVSLEFALANGDIAVDESHIFFSYFDDGELSHNANVFAFNLDGTLATTIADLPEGTSSPRIVIDDSHVYWTDADHERIGRFDTSDLLGNSPEPDFITGAESPSSIAVSSTHVYWAANQGAQLNPGNDLYSLDRETGELTDLAPDITDPNGVEVQGVLGTSEDSSHVYFAANGIPDELVGSPNANGEEATLGNCKNDLELDKATGTCNLYLAHDGEVSFIARLNAASLGTEEENSGDVTNWVADSSGFANSQGKTARVSEDGRTLLFRSRRQLTVYDNQGPECMTSVIGSGELKRVSGPCLELYLYRADEPGLLCVSCSPTGATPARPAKLASLRPPNIGAPETALGLPRNLSADGSRVFFESGDPLVATDTNGYDGCPGWGAAPQARFNAACQDVYEWEAPNTGSCTESSPAYSPANGGCIYLLSTGKGSEASFFADASMDGDDVFIYSFEQLVGQDGDALLDIYDAHAGGGLQGQHEVAAVPCEGEACKGAGSSAPESTSAGSATFQGPGNQSGNPGKPRPRCPKGKRRVRRGGKALCVKPKRHHKRSHKRAAKTTGRAGR